MADYHLTSTDMVVRTSDGVFIPPDPNNRDRQQYEAWLAADNVPDAAEEYPETFAPISDRQFVHALKLATVITHAEAMAFVQIGAIPEALQTAIDAIENQAARESAELIVAGATVFERNHPVTASLGAALGWTSEQVDDLWRTASEL